MSINRSRKTRFAYSLKVSQWFADFSCSGLNHCRRMIKPVEIINWKNIWPQKKCCQNTSVKLSDNLRKKKVSIKIVATGFEADASVLVPSKKLPTLLAN